MTTYSKRRGRRSLAAILAAMLVASVLAVVAGSPAQAANTAGEYLVDHDDNASTAMAREFAGTTRYDTAIRLAERFADDRGGVGTVANAFVASGESLVDAVAVSGLAGYLDAPVLLTPGDMLHGGVKDFIEDYGVGRIHVLGGTAAVSDAVMTALDGLVNKPKVDRIAGVDRYATSAAIADQLEGESWCSTNANSAILASGANDRLFDAIAIGPIANRLELPVLLTSGDEVSAAVLDYIDDHDVEHVQIVGGTDAVSAAVEQALTTAGVRTVKRTAGDSPGELSVEIAKLGSNSCGDDLSPVSNNTVALINSDNMIDGITAAPVLADDADQLGGGLIPILAVGDTLPASVRDYLAATPDEDGSGNKIHMRVLAVGGTAAVSDAVMKAAVDAAASADALTVSIGTIDLGGD
ncbi:MAG: cell wall-binding repeat-containing protein, partial [Acidimicrobiaceae bacterium]|nr:cell wall-binding repeat-containing protein [Acidimicrobiaceae bacterium]